ncbi:HepT-like ribonuclease domain-containing protein [Phormidesmis priestleyi]
MNSRDQAALLDIAKAARFTLTFVSDMTQSDFEADPKTQSAVLYQIAILGEAVKRLSTEFRSQHPEIEWRSVAGMRDKLIHDYENVNLKRVWLTLQSSIPALLSAIESLPLPPD